MTTTGTLTRNTQCQLAATRAPPITGPSAAAAPPTEVQALIVAGALVRPRGGEQQAERGRHEQCPAGRLHDAGRDEHPDVRREGARGRREAEDGHSGEERGAAADQVGRSAGRDEERGEHDRVGVEHPGQVGQVRAAKAAADRRDRHVDDEQVEVATQMIPAETTANTAPNLACLLCLPLLPGFPHGAGRGVGYRSRRGSRSGCRFLGDSARPAVCRDLGHAPPSLLDRFENPTRQSTT